MLNIGERPTISDSEHRIEVHIFDFSADIYGADIKVEFAKRIRDEKQFDNLELLKKQLQIDESNCKKFFRI
jgi:riboflavin kinase/FMN adenylyltransferase